MVIPTQAQIVNLGFGAQRIPFRYDPQQFRLLARHDTTPAPLTDAGLHAALDAPTNSLGLEEVVKPHERAVIVVPDTTRRYPSRPNC
jgi:nickel-dependent lactate racemase